jgi:ABC-type Fe3+/spermidine/putrescine transport system ATPase subunit
VSLQVARGALVALVGPSGSGKSTLLRVIAGFESPDRGEVLLEGRIVTHLPAYERNIGYVFQQYALFPHLSVFENVAYGLRVRQRGDGRRLGETVQHLLQLVRLNGLESRSVDQLSGGQRQRVALARALATDPVLLLLDEPLGALDAHLRLRMQGELRRLNRQLGTTFLLVTANLGEALTMADTVVFMHRGRIQQIGTPNDIVSFPSSVDVAEFTELYNIVPGEAGDTVSDGGSRLVRVATPLGSWVGRLIGDSVPEPGTPVSVLFRVDLPDIAGADLSGADTVNAASCSVQSIEFLGSSYRFYLEPTGDLRLRLQKHASQLRDVGLPRVGQAIQIRWPATQTLVLPKE